MLKDIQCIQRSPSSTNAVYAKKDAAAAAHRPHLRRPFMSVISARKGSFTAPERRHPRVMVRYSFWTCCSEIPVVVTAAHRGGERRPRSYEPASATTGATLQHTIKAELINGYRSTRNRIRARCAGRLLGGAPFPPMIIVSESGWRLAGPSDSPSEVSSSDDGEASRRQPWSGVGRERTTSGIPRIAAKTRDG